jgi:aminoglycoside 2''-phosphotransferase
LGDLLTLARTLVPMDQEAGGVSASHVVDTDQCRMLIATAFPRLALDSVEPLEPGWDSVVFEIDRTWIFRFPTSLAVAESLLREIVLLPEIERRTSTPVPVLQYVGKPSFGYPYYFAGCRKLPDMPLSAFSDVLRGMARRLVCRQIGSFLRDLHSIPTTVGVSRGLVRFDPERWISERLALVGSITADLELHLGSTGRDDYVALVESLAGQIDWNSVPVAVIHGDLGPEHVLIDPSNEHRVSVIDFGDVRLGDPALDFAGLPDELVAGVLERYERDAGRDLLLRRSFYQSVVPAYAVRASSELGRPDLLADGLLGVRHELARLPSEPPE